MNQSKYKVCSLFSGIGGIDLGFKQAGFDVVWANEIDKFAVATYIKNFGDDYVVKKDLRKIEVSQMPDFDILVAGFPCQSFSMMGHQEGFADKERGQMFFRIIDILQIKRPRYVILENVKNLYTHDKGNTFRVIRNELEKLGYSVYFDIFSGFVQALVFTLLSMVYIAGACPPPEEQAK